MSYLDAQYFFQIRGDHQQALKANHARLNRSVSTNQNKSTQRNVGPDNYVLVHCIYLYKHISVYTLICLYESRSAHIAFTKSNENDAGQCFVARKPSFLP